jgi:hypothetical protein
MVLLHIEKDLQYVARPMATHRCLISAIDVDGVGRRLEASFSCIAAAHALGASYVHSKLFELQHGANPSLVDAWFGLPRAFPALTTRRARIGEPSVRVNSHLAALATEADQQYTVVLRARSPDEHTILHHTPRTLCDGLRATPAIVANRSWLHALAADATICRRDGRHVYVHCDCTFFFWCTVVTERAASWFAVLPKLQWAYAQARVAQSGHEKLLPWPSSPPNAPIRVMVHLRTVKNRLGGCFRGGALISMLDALRARHAKHYAKHARSTGEGRSKQVGRALQFVVHCDGGVNGIFLKRPIVAQCPSHYCDLGLTLLALANMSDVMIRWPRSGQSVFSHGASLNKSDALPSMHELLQADVLITSESSFSIVPAMLGNMTTIHPQCSSRALPHWHRAPCGQPSRSAARLLVAARQMRERMSFIIGRLEWPPRQRSHLLAGAPYTLSSTAPT